MKKAIYLLALVVAAISCGSSTPDEDDIKEAGRAAILHNLKDLNSANFHHNETVNDLGNNTWQYTETVNATNGFGGSIANNISVKLLWNGNDPDEISSYQIIDMQTQPR